MESLFHQRAPLAETFRRLILALRGSATPHVFVGQLAVYLYRRSPPLPERLAVCGRAPQLRRFVAEVAGRDLTPLPGRGHGLYDRQTKVEIDLLAAGDFAGDRYLFDDVRLPDPEEAVELDGVPVPPLSRLLELLLVSGPRDREDVVALIRANQLKTGYAAHLRPSVRGQFLSCFASNDV
jgi:hypothetical protein